MFVFMFLFSSTNNSARRLQNMVSLQSTVDGDDELSDADDGEDDDLDDVMDDIELSAEDQASLEMFMPKSNTLKGKSLADVIFEKLRAKEAESENAPTHGSNVRFGAGFGMPVSVTDSTQAQEAVRAKLDPKIVEVYTKSVVTTLDITHSAKQPPAPTPSSSLAHSLLSLPSLPVVVVVVFPQGR